MLPSTYPHLEPNGGGSSEPSSLVVDEYIRLWPDQQEAKLQAAKAVPFSEGYHSETSSLSEVKESRLAKERSQAALSERDSGLFSQMLSTSSSRQSRSLHEEAFKQRLESEGRSSPSATEEFIPSSPIVEESIPSRPIAEESVPSSPTREKSTLSRPTTEEPISPPSVFLNPLSQSEKADEFNDVKSAGKTQSVHVHQPRYELRLTEPEAEQRSLENQTVNSSHSPVDDVAVYAPGRTSVAEPVRDLILPVPRHPLEHPENKLEKYNSRESSVSSEDRKAALAKDLEKNEADPVAIRATDRIGFFKRTKARFFATYAPRVEPELVPPTAPTDKEKYSYLRTNRLPLYAAGVFSFLSLSAGMGLFVISSKYFAWFGVFFVLLQLYMGISYAVGLIGKEFDYENHKRVVRENPIPPETCPTVDIYLPVCKEPIEVLRNAWEYVAKLDYPADKLKVYVLDDGAMQAVKDLATSFGFNYICREDRPRLKKAGNLRWAYVRTHGEFFNIYDADFCPRPDFLLELLPVLLNDEKVAIVQSPQFFRTTETHTWVEQGAGAVQELFYRVVQVNRDRWGASICVDSNAIYRRAALEEVGGTAEIGFSEDVHTGFGCVDRGWKVKYIPLCLACGVCPASPRAFFSQQMRWCMGSTTLLSNPEFWKSNLTVGQKICYFRGMMYYSAISLSIFVNPLPGICLLWIRPEFFKYYNLAFGVPSLLYTIVTFRIWSKATFSMNVQFIMVIQSYAYLTAIKDRIFGRALAWTPTGDAKAHKNNKYRTCGFWRGRG